ncbi:MAG: hypothetical protein J6A07_09330 [Firmicutes bacterium]|nr:hypothetical protein [Bacillota bacterium]
MNKLVLSPLEHTWIIDLDGTVLLHNGYLINGEDTFLDGAEDFLKQLPPNDMIVFMTARKSEYREMTENFLKTHGIRYDHIIFDVPYGERILINDRKKSGLAMSVAVNRKRDEFEELNITIDNNL